MYGTYYPSESEFVGENAFVGYVGVISHFRPDGSKSICFFTEAGSASAEREGRYEITYDANIRTLISRGQYNLFDSESEVRSAFSSWNKRHNIHYTLERVFKIKYISSIQVLDIK